MSDYPTVLVGIDLGHTNDILKIFLQGNSYSEICRKGQAIYHILLKGSEVWIMHKSYYEEWCKGRTYYKDGKLYHSGYELKGANNG